MNYLLEKYFIVHLTSNFMHNNAIMTSQWSNHDIIIVLSLYEVI